MNSKVDLGGTPVAARQTLVPVRYRILGLLFVLSFVNYFLRNNFSVAQTTIQDEFHFSHAQIGWILGSFNVAYTLFNIPGGVFGDVFGSRRAKHRRVCLNSDTRHGPPYAAPTSGEGASFHTPAGRARVRGRPIKGWLIGLRRPAGSRTSVIVVRLKNRDGRTRSTPVKPASEDGAMGARA